MAAAEGGTCGDIVGLPHGAGLKRCAGVGVAAQAGRVAATNPLMLSGVAVGGGATVDSEQGPSGLCRASPLPRVRNPPFRADSRRIFEHLAAGPDRRSLVSDVGAHVVALRDPPPP